MEILLSEEEFRKISRYVSDNLGLHFAPDRQSDLERGLKNAGREAGFEDIKSYVDFLLKAPVNKEHTNLLALNLTIGETYFFRENRIFDILKKDILKDLIGTKEKIRIWSAGSCTGEEAYSIAIAVDELFPEERKKDVSILGTDINTDFLKKASDGVYSQWSFRNVPEGIKKKYFTTEDSKKFRIIPRIQKMVKFSYLNLIEDIYPSVLNETNAMDVIFCRNVLLYFNRDGTEKVINGFYNSLVEGGWFIPGMSELSHLKSPKFKSINFTDSILYRKLSEDSPAGKYIKAVESAGQTAAAFKANEDLSAKVKELLTPRPSQRKKSEAKQEEVKQERNYSFASAQRLYDSGDYSGSAEQFEYLFKNKMLLRSETDESYIMLSKSYANLGDIRRAKQWCGRGIESNKLNPILYLLMCSLLQEENKTSEAAEAVKKAIYLDPDYTMAHFTLASIYRRNGSNKDAQRHYRIALDILGKMSENETVEGSEGMSAGRLKNIILSFAADIGEI